MNETKHKTSTYTEEGIKAMLVVETFLWRLGKVALQTNLDGRQKDKACWHEDTKKRRRSRDAEERMEARDGIWGRWATHTMTTSGRVEMREWRRGRGYEDTYHRGYRPHPQCCQLQGQVREMEKATCDG